MDRISRIEETVEGGECITYMQNRQERYLPILPILSIL
jgi:hypothetical protein